MVDDIKIKLFEGFEGCIFPGDVTGYIIPVTLRTIFRSYVDIDNNNNPFLLALSTEGDLLVGFEEKGFNQPWMLLTSLVKDYRINKRLGTI
jgi:hypothetical protein